MLSVDDITVSYGKALALHGVSLKVEEGEFVGIIGANRAGNRRFCAPFPGSSR